MKTKYTLEWACRTLGYSINHDMKTLVKFAKIRSGTLVKSAPLKYRVAIRVIMDHAEVA